MIDHRKLVELLKCNDEYNKFEQVAEKLSTRADLHAFLLLDRLAPGSTKDLVGGAVHDEIYLDVNLDALCKNATEEHVIDLRRCGVRYDNEFSCLAMFV